MNSLCQIVKSVGAVVAVEALPLQAKLDRWGHDPILGRSE